MNNKNKAILGGIGLFSLLLSTSSPYAASDSASQTLKLTIPKVALVEIAQTQYTFTFDENSHLLKQSSPIAISSNDQNARLNIKVTGLPEGVNVNIETTGKVCKQSPMNSTQNNSFSCLVGMARTRDGSITFTTTRANQQNVPNGSYKADLIYTLSD